jgi:mRNA interferase MazF
MLSTRRQQEVPGFDEVIDTDADDFQQSGLKTAIVLRIARLAVVSDEMLLGCIGAISKDRLGRIRRRLANWLEGAV